MQKLGLPTAELTEAVRQQTRAMKTAVATARSGDYAASLQSLDKIISGEGADIADRVVVMRSEEHTSELQSLMRISYAVFCLKKKKTLNIPRSIIDRQT